MRTLKNILLFSLYLAICMGCKTTYMPKKLSSTSENIIGFWKGCDDRIIAFSKDQNGDIVGRYIQIGGLAKYKFVINEVGYRITEQSPGIYTGTVKWRDNNGNESWKKVTISIKNNTYRDDSSDPCSKEMTKVD